MWTVLFGTPILELGSSVDSLIWNVNNGIGFKCGQSYLERQYWNWVQVWTVLFGTSTLELCSSVDSLIWNVNAGISYIFRYYKHSVLSAKLSQIFFYLYRSPWSRGLSCGAETAQLLGLRVRIPLEACLSVTCHCFLLSGILFCYVFHSSKRVLSSVMFLFVIVKPFNKNSLNP